MLLDLNDWRLNPRKAVAPQLRVILRSRIVRNQLKPSSRLSESDLAKEYQVSRQPVREAFITLEHEGLLEIRPQRGTFVKPIDVNSVLGGRFVREAFEADVVHNLAQTPDTSLIKELRSQLKEQAAIADVNPAKFIELDEVFHETLAIAAGIEQAWGYLEAVKAQMDRVRFISFVEFPIHTLIAQHGQIVDKIEEGDADAAERSMRRHLKEILNSLPRIQQLYPQYFAGGGGKVNDP
ncbi:putative HTH-type transcriptional regulator YdfH [Thalassovita autumnalis]|uniref:HTH-type transcriptional regulator YdfH n=1 Tax=Thalassovita autumnalis TaxID=2072972 RepID=A0A0P1FNZ9_9RHOB|nr:GntR family transcriptional regulator [Thalassovita autumnalis]CUH69996.1 putative HTH-type transcriptional regulator YdfH [Thalassovita autumnalis]CUH72374.1 putative HTH-type transcriptional regulator YdfH [Thalassovita autumnalis]